MRRLFRSEGLNPNTFKWRDLLPLLNPREWDTLFWLLLPVVGAFVAAYAAGLWAIHFVSTGAWGFLLLTVTTFFVVTVSAWLRFTWASYLLAGVAGLGATVLFSGHLDVLLP